MTLDGDAVTWKLTYAAKTSAAGAKYNCTVTFMTMSEKLAWLNQTICVMEGESRSHLARNQRILRVELATHALPIL